MGIFGVQGLDDFCSLFFSAIGAISYRECTDLEHLGSSRSWTAFSGLMHHNMKGAHDVASFCYSVVSCGDAKMLPKRDDYEIG